MPKVAEWNKEDGTTDLCVVSKETDGNGLKVVLFPEPGGQYEIHHNVEEGDQPGQVTVHHG